MNKVLPIKDIETIKAIKKYYKEKEKYRDLLFFVLSINTALQVHELLALKVKDVKDKKILTVKESPRKKRDIPLNSEIRRYIKIVVGDRKSNDHLFISVNGKPLERTAVFRRFKEVCKNLKLGKKLSVGSFRKTFGWHYYQQYKDLSFITYMYNQGNLKQTMEYLGIKENLKERFNPEFKL